MIKIISFDDTNTWDELVRGFNSGDVYYYSGYLKAFQLHGDGVPNLFYYEDGNFRALNVFMKRDIAKCAPFRGILEPDKYYDIVTPYGYGGFLFEGDASEGKLIELNSRYSEWCRQQNIVSEFVRFSPIIGNDKYCKSIYETFTMGPTITMNLESKEKIWEELSSKNRNMIRKSIKSGVKIYWGRNSDLMDTFIPMYEKTMEMDNATQYYYFDKSFYKSILCDNKNKSLIFYAEVDGQIISMAIIIYHNNYMHYHLSAMNKDFRNLGSMNLLLYEAACWGSDNGMKFFHLGGGVGNSEDRLYKFKSSFNSNSKTTFTIGKKIFNIEDYNFLCKMRNTDIETEYFPAYRCSR